MSFQLITGNERFYVMAIYIPPNCMMGVDDLQVAWEACPPDCTPLVVGYLNIWFEDPANNRVDAIVPPISPAIFSLNDAASSGDGRAGPSACGGGGEWCYSQLDYFLGNERITKRLRRVVFCLPQYHDLDHQTVIATFWGGSTHLLKSYQRN
jgi:hypothetical protein